MNDDSLFGDDEPPAASGQEIDNDDTETPVGDDDDANPHRSILKSLETSPPPDALPIGWVAKHSRTHPGCVYYYHQDTGDCRWEAPFVPRKLASSDGSSALAAIADEVGDVGRASAAAAAAIAATAASATGLPATSTSAAPPAPAVRSILKKSSAPPPVVVGATGEAESALPTADSAQSFVGAMTAGKRDRRNGGGDRPSKSSRVSSPAPSSSPSNGEAGTGGASSSSPKEVRVLHLLKKHRGSRRPASWRNPNITDTKEEAMKELKELIGILKESESDPKELRATFEELARTESDCSSAKRGGDLGFFGRRKMQPAFEKASFGLKVGELSGIVETSSGVHVILRLA